MVQPTSRSAIHQFHKKRQYKWRLIVLTISFGIFLLICFWGVYSYNYVYLPLEPMTTLLHPVSKGDAISRWSMMTTESRSTTTTMDVSVCLTDACIGEIATQLSRAYPFQKDKSKWCHSDNVPSNSIQFMGLLLTKVPKSASSTMAGVALRLANRYNCTRVYWQHRLATDYASTHQPQSSFFMTSIRNPATRAISTIFFHIVSRTSNVKQASSDNFIIQQLLNSTHPHYGTISDGQGGFQLRYMSLDDIPQHSAWNSHFPTKVQQPSIVVDNVRRVLHSYNFILVTERMDESLTVLALLLGVDVADVLVTASKVAGSNYHLLHSNRQASRCVPTVTSFVSETVAKLLSSNMWRAMNYGDYLLHAAANISLDRTIDQTIGRSKFDKALQRYRKLRRMESIQCAPHVIFPCSNDGIPQIELAAQNCYLRYHDFGCGYPCIDAIVYQDSIKDKHST